MKVSRNEDTVIIHHRGVTLWSLHDDLELRDVPHEYDGKKMVISINHVPALFNCAEFEADHGDTAGRRRQNYCRKLADQLKPLLQ